MKKNQETNTVVSLNSCEHCNRTFVRETTLFKHLCEQKRRWLDKDRPAFRIGFAAWIEFYASFQPSKKNKDVKTFISSPYYAAFVKFGSYCVDVRAVNTVEYIKYLISNKIPLDNWNTDRVYTKYLIEYLKLEDAFDAVKRSIQNIIELTQEENIQVQDIFRYVNANKICYLITTGRISPWVLYQSTSGIEFLEKLNSDQQKLVFEYIDPERWTIKFKRDQQLTEEIKQTLKLAGL